MEEIWKDIIDFEGLYQISNLGRVKRLAGEYRIGKGIIKNSVIVIPEKLISINLYKHGYTYVSLSKNNRTKKFKVHRLLGLHFIPNPG